MDTSEIFNRKLIAGLALAGFASGILSIISSELLSNIPRLQELRLLLYVPGAIFGLMVSAYCAMFLRMRSWARLLAFVAASVGAYFLAVWLTVLSVVNLREELPREWAFNSGMFLGGMAGAFVVLTTAQLLLSTRRTWRTASTTALLWSLAGGALGVVGWTLGGSAGKLFWLAMHVMRLTLSDSDLQSAVSTQTVNVFSLFVLWQACMAPLLGWLVSKNSAAQPEHQSTAST